MPATIAGVPVAKAEIVEIEAAIENSILKSPSDGFVASISRQNNSGVSPGDTILTIAVSNLNLVQAYVSEKWLSSLWIGK